MCTLTYFPIDNEHVIITSNRDESITRKSALLPQLKDVEKDILLAPIDGEAGGTWIAAAKTGRVACTLNGAFGPHISRPPYRKSRGLVLLDAFSSSPEDLIDNYDLSGIEPFTLVQFSLQGNRRIVEMKWDGEKKYIQEYDPERPHIWSAPMLYPPEVIADSEEKYRLFLSAIDEPDAETLLNFHHTEKYREKMGRHNKELVPILHTLSITSIEYTAENLQMRYHDLRNNLHAQYSLQISSGI